MERIKIPNLIKMMKNFELKVNPNYEKFLGTSDNFIKKFGGKYVEQFLSEDRPLFYAMVCPTASIENLHLMADLYNFLWFYDEVTDEDPSLGQEYGKKLLEVVENPEVEVDFLIGESAKDIIKRLRSSTSPENFKKLCDFVKVLINSQVRETKRRETGAVLNLDDYMQERLQTSGAEAWLFFSMIVEKVELSNELEEDENFKILRESYLKASWVINDTYSFAREFSRNTCDSNLLTAIKLEKNLSYQEAFDEVGKIYQKLMDSFIESEEKLLTNSCDEETKRAVEFFKWNLRGIAEWHTITRRYVKDENFKENHIIKIKIE